MLLHGNMQNIHFRHRNKKVWTKFSRCFVIHFKHPLELTYLVTVSKTLSQSICCFFLKFIYRVLFYMSITNYFTVAWLYFIASNQVFLWWLWNWYKNWIIEKQKGSIWIKENFPIRPQERASGQKRVDGHNWIVLWFYKRRNLDGLGFSFFVCLSS